MQEQPTHAPSVVTGPAFEEQYTWQHVARDMSDWHPDLQEHAKRHLGARGLLAESVSSGAERPKTSDKEIAAAFLEGQRMVTRWTRDAEFHAKCFAQRLDPHDDMGNPSYWNIFADFAQSRISAMREKHGDSLRLRTFEIVAATPRYLFEEEVLNRGENASYSQREHAKEVAGGYNGLIRNFATDFPETKVSTLTLALLHTANNSIEGIGTRQFASHQLKAAIRGAQHECAFSQILSAAGIPYRHASVAEDLQGKDYIINEASGRPLAIDVKASKKSIKGFQNGSLFWPKAKGEIVMHSLTEDYELGDKFYVSAEAAKAKVATLSRLLENAQNQAA